MEVDIGFLVAAPAGSCGTGGFWITAEAERCCDGSAEDDFLTIPPLVTPASFLRCSSSRRIARSSADGRRAMRTGMAVFGEEESMDDDTGGLGDGGFSGLGSVRKMGRRRGGAVHRWI